MKYNNQIICNVCMLSSAEDEHAVFISANKNGQDIDICTSCMPSVIHGSGMVVKSEKELLEELNH